MMQKMFLNVRIDRNRKIPGTVLLRALGLSSNEDIIDVFGDHEFILNTLAKIIQQTQKKL